MLDLYGEEVSPSYRDEEFPTQGKVVLFMRHHNFHRHPLIILNT